MIEKARIGDPPAILGLIRHYSSLELMLPRSLNSIFDSLRDFHVCRENDEVIGCAALHIAWQGLAEVRSLAVAESAQGRGIGRGLVGACLREAREMNVERVFVLTYVPEFFAPFGFQERDKDELPHKVWADCINCPKFPDCDEFPLMRDVNESPSGDSTQEGEGRAR